MTARPRTRRRQPEPTRDAPNYNSRHAPRERRDSASAGNGCRTTFPDMQRAREPLVSLTNKKREPLPLTLHLIG